MIKLATMIDFAIPIALKIQPLFKGRPDDDPTAHIHFALCETLDGAGARPSALFKGSMMMTLRHISILLYVISDTRWCRRDHIKQIRYVP